MRPHAGFDPRYLAKLSNEQRCWIEKQEAKDKVGTGVKFVKDFVFKRGLHCYVVGNTGSGKTSKGYYLLDWLKHTETIIWISSGKTNEILPLLCMGKKVRIIIPKDADFSIEEYVEGEGWDLIRNNPPEIVRVGSAAQAWYAVKGPAYPDGHHREYDTINIFEFRRTISPRAGVQAKWMIELFETLATFTYNNERSEMFPCTIFIDESQWVLSGARVDTGHQQVKMVESVSKDVLEMRSIGCRFILFAQGYKNISPIIRENMTCTLLCRGSDIESNEHSGLSVHCHLKFGRRPVKYKVNMGKFVYDDMSAYPVDKPWLFPLFPRDQEDRDWIERCRVSYGHVYDGRETEQEIIDTECIPELGRYAAAAIRPDEPEPVLSKWDAAGACLPPTS